MVKMRTFLAVFHVELLMCVSRGTLSGSRGTKLVNTCSVLQLVTIGYNVVVTVADLCEWGNENGRGGFCCY